MKHVLLFSTLLSISCMSFGQALINDSSGVSSFQTSDLKGGMFEFGFNKPSIRLGYRFNSDQYKPWFAIDFSAQTQSGISRLFDGEDIDPGVRLAFTYGISTFRPSEDEFTEINDVNEKARKAALLKVPKSVRDRVTETVVKANYAALCNQLGVIDPAKPTKEQKEKIDLQINALVEKELINLDFVKELIQKEKKQLVDTRWPDGLPSLESMDTYLTGYVTRAKYKMFDSTLLPADQLFDEDFTGWGITAGISRINRGTTGVAATLGYEKGNNADDLKKVSVQTTTGVGPNVIVKNTDALTGTFEQLNRIPFNVDMLIYPKQDGTFVFNMFSRMDLNNTGQTHILGFALILVEPGSPTMSKGSLVFWHKKGRFNIGLNVGLKF